MTRRILQAALAIAIELAGSFAALVMPARAQDWPTRPISLVVPFGPGSGTDPVARILAPAIGDRLGRPIVVQNVGGAGGLIGVSRVAKAAPDGSEEHAGTDRRQVQCGAIRCARSPRIADALARGGSDRGSARAPLARLPARLS